MEETIVRRADGVKILERILPPARETVNELHDLAMKFSAVDWKDQFVRFWQQQACIVAELEAKTRELGGALPSDTPVCLAKPNEIGNDLVLHNKNLLARCLNSHAQLVHVYSDVLRSPLSFDVKMVLQRHQLQTQETMDRLTVILENYLLRTTRIHLHAELKSSSPEETAIPVQSKFSPQPLPYPF